MAKHNPWDQTIWDPINPEHAIEDPMHGPSAVNDLLQIPAMPCGDGTYYQPGSFYADGTPYRDSQNRKIYRIGGTVMSSMQEGIDLQEWIEAHHSGGEEALVELEAKRQKSRLEETGFAFCFKTSDVCPGGKKLSDCATGIAAFDAGQDWSTEHAKEAPGEGTLYNTLAWAGSKCVECSVSCDVSVKTIDGIPQETRVSFFELKTL